ncbi:MAG: 3D domain-containing protein [Bacillota bacterium]
MKTYLRQHSSMIKLAVIAVVCLVLTTSFVYSAMKKDITISDIDGQKNISTFKSTVGEVLKENNIQLAPFDKVNEKMDAKLKDGTQINISRANMIIIKTNELSKFLFTTAKDVKAALMEAEMYIGELDRVEPSLETAIAGDTTIKVVRVSEEIFDETVEIPFVEQIVRNDKLDKGQSKLVQKGQKGQKQISTKITYEDGKEVDRQVIGEKILKQAVNRITEEGTRTTLVTSRGQTYTFVKSMVMSATAYDATFESCGKHEDDPYYGITASGLRVRPGIVAVDPKVIPLGTWLYVEGYGEALAADTGGAIKGNKIDLYFESPDDVRKFGRKKLKVYILDKPRYKFR